MEAKLNARFEAWLDQNHAPDFPKLTRRNAFSERVKEDFRTGWEGAMADQSGLVLAHLAAQQVATNAIVELVQCQDLSKRAALGLAACEAALHVDKTARALLDALGVRP